MELEDELSGLRRELDALGPVGSRGHIKGDLRTRIVVAATRVLGGDVKHADVAEVLGMPTSTLSRWLREDASKPEVRMLREMKVIGGEPDSIAGARGRWPRVVLPNGVVLEGLDTEQIVTILRALT